MITKANFSDLLLSLGFERHADTYLKTLYGHTLQADFKQERLIYPPELVINEHQTTNFSAPENFVVFECVHRLLEKGYQPKHIELEKRWSLGHLQKSGRADISVFCDDSKTALFMIIECKTAGSEYEKALKLLHEDGGQLFSYWQQDRSTQCLVLYASDFDQKNKVSYKNVVIRCQDDAELVKLSAKDSSLKLYKNAFNAEALHQVWQESYAAQTRDQLIFGFDTKAYHLDVAPLRKRDLKEFDPNDKIINKFEEILRHNAVSDKENAFNRLLALFICKLADEIGKSEEAEMEFQYKIGQDSFESLQDRLQHLYQIGMDKFMKEEIFYIPNSYADDLFKDIGNRRNTINDLKETIRKLKFYTNNDFAFKDVHNEELFYQNGKIVVEMVQLFEQYRIVHPNKHQFLGDLFEQLLNKGFKQNEGQFFTPSPITRFIWDCLPLRKILDEKGGDYPKIIDYACGSGHFLTEAVEAVNAAKPSDSNDWTRESIYGIEKDYRLARVSKVSMFMNGAGESNIIFGDGLDNAADKGIENGKFDILVANPPYSVSAFKSHLKMKNNRLALLDFISNSGGEIEVLFCERIAQLLKSGGVGAVILPSSILSNDSSSYTAARTLLLNEFYLRAVVNFGSKTFGATGTNTVVLFLEKRPYPPKASGLAEDQATILFQNDDSKLQESDKTIYAAYLQHINVSSVIYDKLRKQEVSWAFVSGDMGDEYLNTLGQAIMSKISLTKSQEKLPETAQQAVKLSQFFAKFAEIEQEKIALFALLYQNQTLVINAPSDNAKQKAFLGYDWSNRKGAEGIQILHAGGKLYNDADRFAPNTLAAAVRAMFESRTTTVSDENQEYAYLMHTINMVDFLTTSFNRTIRTVETKQLEIFSKYPMRTIGEITSTIETGKRPNGGVGLFSEGAYSLGGEHIGKDNGRLELSTIKYVPMDFFNSAQKGIIRQFDILLCKDGALTGKVAIVRDELNHIPAMINEHVFILRCNEIDTQKYLFNYLYSEIGQMQLKANITGSAQGGLNSTNLKKIKIPLPPLEIQAEICKKCEEIDRLYENSRMKIEEYRAKIAKIFNGLEVVRGVKRFKLNELCTINPPRSEIKSLKNELIVSFVEMASVSNHGFIESKINKPLGELRIGSYTYFAENDVIIAKITPCMENGKCALATGLCNGIGMGSSEFHVFRAKEQRILPAFLFYSLNRETIRKEAEKQMTGSSGHRRVPISFYENLQIVVPDLPKQQQIIAEIETLEAAIRKLETEIAAIPAKKKAVLAVVLN